jgi:hypothetical protein
MKRGERRWEGDRIQNLREYYGKPACQAEYL